ncbi:MAG: hypothetical protein PHI73_04515 [Patescibacteria group bacterium]|nr:hypothetical protein [Patescibacteria group bacterium]
MSEGTKLPEGIEQEEQNEEKVEPSAEMPQPKGWKDLFGARNDPAWKQFLTERGHLVEYQKLAGALRDFNRTGGEKSPADFRRFLKEGGYKKQYKKMMGYLDSFEQQGKE